MARRAQRYAENGEERHKNIELFLFLFFGAEKKCRHAALFPTLNVEEFLHLFKERTNENQSPFSAVIFMQNDSALIESSGNDGMR